MKKQIKQYASDIICLYTRLPTQRDEVSEPGEQLVRSGMTITALSNHLALPLAHAESCAAMESLADEIEESQIRIKFLREDCCIKDPQLKSLHQEAADLASNLRAKVAKWTAGLQAANKKKR